jgi:hypothetical protein
MRSEALKEVVKMVTMFRDHKKDLYKYIDFPNALIGSINEFDKIIGLEELKKTVSRIIKLVIVEKSKKRCQYGENNIVLCGNPGCGKTTVAGILAKVLNSIGVHPEKYKNKDENDKKDPLSSFKSDVNPIKLMMGQLNRDKIESLQTLSQNLRKKNILYQNYIRDISEASNRQIAILNESIQFIDRHNSQRDKEDFLGESRNLMVEGGKQSKYIVGLINSFEENLKKIEFSEEGKKSIDKKQKEVETVFVDNWGEIRIEKDFKNKYKHTSPSDFVAGFVGQTPAKTRGVLESAKGGVLFIDEAYDIAVPNRDNTRGADYGFQALTEIVNFMTQEEGAVSFIIAGYQEDLEKNLFGLQKGLNRRFRFKIHIGNYSSEELADIFRGMIEKSGLKIDPNVDISSFFRQKEEQFSEFGGDCRTLSTICRELMAEKEIDRIVTLVSSSEDTNEEEIFIDSGMLQLAFKIKEKNRRISPQSDKSENYFSMYN